MEAPLNFAKAPFRNERVPRIFFGVVAGALVVATLWHAIVLTRYLLREAEELDVTVQGMEDRRSGLVADIERTHAVLNEERNDAMSQRVAFLANLYQQKGFSWTELFNQLESVVPPDVRITSISPSAARGEIEVRLTTVGRSLEDLLTLVRSLEESRFFGTVMPLNEAHQEAEGTVSSMVTLRYHAAETQSPTEMVHEGASSDEAPPTEPAGPADHGVLPEDDPDGENEDWLGNEDSLDDSDELDDFGDEDVIEDNDA